MCTKLRPPSPLDLINLFGGGGFPRHMSSKTMNREAQFGVHTLTTGLGFTRRGLLIFRRNALPSLHAGTGHFKERQVQGTEGNTDRQTQRVTGWFETLVCSKPQANTRQAYPTNAH